MNLDAMSSQHGVLPGHATWDGPDTRDRTRDPHRLPGQHHRVGVREGIAVRPAEHPCPAGIQAALSHRTSGLAATPRGMIIAGAYQEVTGRP
jgi:hypothetical protein